MVSVQFFKLVHKKQVLNLSIFTLDLLCDARVSELIFMKLKFFSESTKILHRKLSIDEI